MARKFTRAEVIDSIEDAVANAEPGYLSENELRAVSVAVLKELEAEGMIDDREVDL